MTTNLSGLELRAAVGKEVFGRLKNWVDSIRGEVYCDAPDSLRGIPLPHYESDIAAAFTVVGKMRERGLWFKLTYLKGYSPTDLDNMGWLAEFRGGNMKNNALGWHQTNVATAICLAALAATQAPTGA